MIEGWSRNTRRVLIGTGLRHRVPDLRRPTALLKCLSLVLLVALTRPLAWALDPTTPLSQAGHTAWRVQDAPFGGTPLTMTRTTDGYLWIATTSDLVRFDGVRFTPWEQATGQPEIASLITSLRGASDGSLWIGTAGHLLHWDGRSLITYQDHTGIMSSIMEARDKTIWIARGHSGDKEGPLCQALSQSLRCHGADEGIPGTFLSEIAQDTNGDFLLGTISRVLRWSLHSRRQTTNHMKEISGQGFGGFIPTPDGDVWAGFSEAGKRRGLEILRGDQFIEPTITGLVPESLRITSMFRDSHGAIWCGTYRTGVIRIYKGHAEHYTVTDGLSGNSVGAINEDHEGNIWIVTSSGIDRLRDLSFKLVYGPDSGSGLVEAILALHDGSVLFTMDGKLFSLRDGRPVRIKDPPGETVTSMFEDSEHRLWIGCDDRLYLYSQNKYAPISMLGSANLGSILELTESKDGTLWAIAATPERTLYRVSSRTLNATRVSLSAPPYALAADPIEGVWVGLRNGSLVHLAGTKLAATLPPSIGQEWPLDITLDADGTMFVGTGSGLNILQHGIYLPVSEPKRCNSLRILNQGPHESLWVTSLCGIARYSTVAIHGMTSHAQVTSASEFFDIYDGAQTITFGTHILSVGADGRVWLASREGLRVLDPAHLTHNPFPPPVYIEELIADKRRYWLQKSLRLPARTRDLQIDYTALSFAVPQKVHFRYRLEGRDIEWQDPGNRRQAFYTDLRPGRYRFHVIASNNDGVWNTRGDTVDFSIAPAFYQTLWFQIFLGLIVASVTWLLYYLRLRRVTAGVKSRLEERLNERERIARELHDTLLQGFQAVILHLQTALKRLGAEDPARRILEQGLDYADEVLVEGRDRVQDLRNDAMAVGELSEALARYGNEVANSRPVSFSMTVNGSQFSLDPIIRDEVYRIGREALGNAFKHSNGSIIEAEIVYDIATLRMRVRDNGDGIDSQVLISGRSGHWGLSGMRERAHKIGAELNIWSRPNAGTELELILPLRFANRRQSKWLRWKSLMKETK